MTKILFYLLLAALFVVGFVTFYSPPKEVKKLHMPGGYTIYYD